jgi:hypothetical protein
MPGSGGGTTSSGSSGGTTAGGGSSATSATTGALAAAKGVSGAIGLAGLAEAGLAFTGASISLLLPGGLLILLLGVVLFMLGRRASEEN